MPEEPLTQFRSTKRHKLLRQWPLLVWLGAAILAGALLVGANHNLRIDGVVEVVTESVGSAESGLVVSVPVTVGQRVRPGEIVAQLDTSLIEQEIEVTKETIRRRRSDTLRLHTNSINRLESDRRSLVMRMAEDTARLGVLRREVEKLEELVNQRLVTADILIGNRARIASLESSVAIYPSLIQEIDDEIEENRRVVETLHSEENLQAEFTANLAYLENRREARSLRARHDGVISGIPHQPGEVVRVGDPVVRLIIDQPPRILGFLHEQDLDRVANGQEVTLTPANQPSEEIEGRVVNIIPRINLVPDTSSPLPNRMSRGMTIVVDPEAPYPFTPGQKIEIRLRPTNLIERFKDLVGRSLPQETVRK